MAYFPQSRGRLRPSAAPEEVAGFAVGVVYGLVQVRSPAPPLIALVGLLGMVLGEQAIYTVRHHLLPPPVQPAAPRPPDLTRVPCRL